MRGRNSFQISADIKYLTDLRDPEHSVCQEPNTAGVPQHFSDRDLGWAYSKLPTKAGVVLTVQRYRFATDVGERFIPHRECQQERAESMFS